MFEQYIERVKAVPRDVYLYWGLLYIPLLVVLLPGFQTTLTEDAILLVLGGGLLLRVLEDERYPIPETIQPVLSAVVLGIVYGIAWLGLVRGYYDGCGRFLGLFPAAIVAAYFYQPEVQFHPSKPFRTLQKLWIVVVILTVFLLIVWGRSVIQYYNLYYSLTKQSLPALLMVLPIAGLMTCFAPHIGGWNRRWEHLPMLIAVWIVLCGVWAGNAKTWTVWYLAGFTERQWTPFKFDKPEEIAAAERKPYEAAQMYFDVLQRLETKGELPDYWNWTFFMKYRMALNALRKEDFPLAVASLPPSIITRPNQIAHLKSLWTEERLWDMQHGEIGYKHQDRIWIDIDTSFDREQAYALDRFGRVYSFKQDRIWLEWDPGHVINDAVDLEILDGVFLVLRADGNVLHSKPVAFLEGTPFPKSPEQRFVDMEILPDGRSAIAITDYGQYFAKGELPEGFPTWRDLYFGRSAVVDMEIDSSGMGYYLLDMYGGLHYNSKDGTPSIPYTSPPIAAVQLPYWGEPMAVELELDTLKRSLMIYTKYGEVYTVSVEPHRPVYKPAEHILNYGAGIVSMATGELKILQSNGALVEVP